MIQTANDIFVLHTAHTTYAFRKLPTGQLEHLYYGRKIHVCEPLDENAVAPLIEKNTFQPGNSCVYDREHDAYTLEDLCLEMSAYGKGDIREPFVELIYEDGSFSSDFVYESSVRFEGREARDAEDALPASYDEKNQVEHLCVTLKDNNSALKLEPAADELSGRFSDIGSCVYLISWRVGEGDAKMGCPGGSREIRKCFLYRNFLKQSESVCDVKWERDHGGYRGLLWIQSCIQRKPL